MPALMKTTLTAEVTYLGATGQDGSIRAGSVDRLDLTFDGVAGARHAGGTRPSCVRVRQQYEPGTEIRNARQLTVLSDEEMGQIGAKIGVAPLDPGLLGATLVLRGIPDFSHLPPSSRLQAPSGATLVIDMENRPCQFPAKEIENDHSGHGKAFKAAATGKRGVTAWVERPGVVAMGDVFTLHIPDQRVWAHLDEHLSDKAKA